MSDNTPTQFEETSMENVWLKTHVLDILDRISQYEVMATTGDTSNFNESPPERTDQMKFRLSALENMEAELNILYDNVATNINQDANQILINLRLKTPEKFLGGSKIYNSKEDQRDHTNDFFLEDGFYKMLDNLKKAKALLIQSCAKAGMFVHVKDEEMKGKRTEADPEELE